MRLRFTLHLLMLLPLTLLAGCEETPNGRSQLTLVPENLMTQMGEDAFDQLQSQQPVSSDVAVNRQVQCSGSIIPDTNLGGKIATINEVSDDQKTTFLYA